MTIINGKLSIEAKIIEKEVKLDKHTIRMYLKTVRDIKKTDRKSAIQDNCNSFTGEDNIPP